MNVKKTNVIVKKDLIWQRSALASPARKTIVKDHILILILINDQMIIIIIISS